MSARKRDPTVTMSPFRISNAMFPPRRLSRVLVNFDAHIFAILLHLLPILCNFALRLGRLAPSHGRASRRLFDHADAILDGANVVAKTATDAVFLANVNTRT